MRSYSNTEIEGLINEYIHSKRDREIVYERLVNGLTFLELSEKFHLCDRQIQRIVRKADTMLCKMK